MKQVVLFGSPPGERTAANRTDKNSSKCCSRQTAYMLMLEKRDKYVHVIDTMTSQKN